MTNLQIGERAPGFALERLDGDRVSLGEMLAAGQSQLLVFLRHLG